MNSAEKEKIRLVYALAASHSGSTLLTMLLASHPDICTTGELKLTSLGDSEKYLCSCRQKIKECPFWMSVSGEMAKRGYDFDPTNAAIDLTSGASSYAQRLLRPLHRGKFLEAARDSALALSPEWRSHLRNSLARNQALIESIAELTGKNIIIDSSKIGIRLKYLLRIKELDVRVVRLTRDGRGAALTYLDPARFADAKNPDLRAGGHGGNRESERLSIEEAAHEWRRSNEEAEAVLRGLDRDKWIQVRYEDLCSSPDSVLRKIYDFVGAGKAERFKDFREAGNHVVGNGMRLDETSEIKLDERWKTELSQLELEKFNSVAGAMNRRLGYE